MSAQDSIEVSGDPVGWQISCPSNSPISLNVKPCSNEEFIVAKEGTRNGLCRQYYRYCYWKLNIITANAECPDWIDFEESVVV
jgi:hypothetical protein